MTVSSLHSILVPHPYLSTALLNGVAAGNLNHSLALLNVVSSFCWSIILFTLLIELHDLILPCSSSHFATLSLTCIKITDHHLILSYSLFSLCYSSPTFHIFQHSSFPPGSPLIPSCSLIDMHQNNCSKSYPSYTPCFSLCSFPHFILLSFLSHFSRYFIHAIFAIYFSSFTYLILCKAEIPYHSPAFL